MVAQIQLFSQVKARRRRCCFAGTFLALSLLLSIVPPNSEASANASVPVRPRPSAASHLSNGICSLFHFLEPYDNADLLGGMFKWLDGDDDFPLEKVGAFGFLTLVNHTACSRKENRVKSRLRVYLPSLNTLQNFDNTGPGAIVTPIVTTFSPWSSLGDDQYKVTLAVQWLSIGATPVTTVDIALEEGGGTGTSTYQTYTVTPSSSGVYSVEHFSDTLQLDQWYQEAVRVDDAAGTSPWSCSTQFRIVFDPEPVVQFQLESATTLAIDCPN